METFNNFNALIGLAVILAVATANIGYIFTPHKDAPNINPKHLRTLLHLWYYTFIASSITALILTKIDIDTIATMTLMRSMLTITIFALYMLTTTIATITTFALGHYTIRHKLLPAIS